MNEIAGFPFQPVHFDKSGVLLGGAQNPILDLVNQEQATDVLVVSHGWRNSEQDAEGLYQRLLTSMRQAIDSGHSAVPDGRKLVVAGIYWPALFFDEGVATSPGGAVTLDADRGREELVNRLAELRDFFGDDEGVDAAIAAAEGMFDGTIPERNQAFVTAVLDLLPPASEDMEAEHPFEQLAQTSGDKILEALDRPLPPEPPTAAAANIFGDAVNWVGDQAWGIFAGAKRLVNYTSYYVMRERAGVIGAQGLHPLLAGVPAATRVHLAGHSFGARLVTAAARGNGQTPLRPSSISLLQAAFSHYSFAENYDGNKDGYYRSVVANGNLASGSMIVTHTKNDKAVGLAYALASRLANQVAAGAAGLGDSGDFYGGLGRNGAQKTPEVTASIDMRDVGQAYPEIASGKLVNLRADGHIADHGDVTNKHVAYAVLTAVQAS